MKIERFEDLVAWQHGRALCRDVYLLTQQPPFTRDSALTHQIRKSAISIPSNVAEGFERFRPATLMAKAEETARKIGALRKSVERQKATQHAALSTQD